MTFTTGSLNWSWALLGNIYSNCPNEKKDSYLSAILTLTIHLINPGSGAFSAYADYIHLKSYLTTVYFLYYSKFANCLFAKNFIKPFAA